MRPAWHALLAPLPPEAKPRRAPVGAIAGWEQLTVELSAGAAGLRHVMVILEAGRPIAASDCVLHVDGRRTLHENIGGRIEADGSFRGTRWRTVMIEAPASDEAHTEEMARAEPSAQDIEGIGALVAGLLERAG